MSQIKTRLCEGGRVVIPASYRKALGIKPGDDVVLVLEEGEVRLLTVRQAVKRAQALLRIYVPEGRELSRELIRERREEVAG